MVVLHRNTYNESRLAVVRAVVVGGALRFTAGTELRYIITHSDTATHNPDSYHII